MSADIIKQNNQVAQFNFLDAEQFQTIQRVCQVFINSELVPKIYRVSEENPEKKAIANCMIALEIANRIGASPLMVMQNLDIIEGHPSWSAKFLTATVNTCGRFNPIKYKMEKIGALENIKYTEYEWKSENGKRFKAAVEKTLHGPIENWQCIAYTSAIGSEEVLESIPVTTEMAVKERWFTKAGSKWQTMPKLMLQYRSVTFWTRAYAPELSMGMKTEDEIQDISYEEIPDKVNGVIKENANKQAITIDDDKKDSVTKNEEQKKEPVTQKEEVNPI